MFLRELGVFWFGFQKRDFVSSVIIEILVQAKAASSQVCQNDERNDIFNLLEIKGRDRPIDLHSNRGNSWRRAFA